MKQVYVNKVDDGFKKDENLVYLAIVGSRSISDETLIHKYIDAFIALSENELEIPRDAYVVVSGGANGVDSFAERYADQRNLSSVIIKPD
ncbi:MAG: SLOG family protein [Desulfosoma sp.]